MDAVHIGLVGFDFQRFHKPHGQIANDEEGDDFSSRSRRLHFDTAAAAAQAVDDCGRLQDDLNHLRE
jgi:hypothetical protein